MKDAYRDLERWRNSFKAKESILKEHFGSSIEPSAFYRDLFPEGSLQPQGGDSDGLGCAIYRFQPDIADYKRQMDFLEAWKNGELTEELTEEEALLWQDWGEVKKVKERLSQKRYQSLKNKWDKGFGAGVYHKSGEPYLLTHEDKHTGKRVATVWDRRIHDDFQEFGNALGKRFAMMAPISYFGKKANTKNARYLFAIVLDIDAVTADTLRRMIWHIDNDPPRKSAGLPYFLSPTYIVNSGHGVHLYYFLDEPVPMYKYVIDPIKKLKERLAELYWKVGSIVKDHIDPQGTVQQYRVVGSFTKLGKGYLTSAYRVSGKRYSLEELVKAGGDNGDVIKPCIKLPLEEYRPRGTSGHDLEYWKQENPEWYKRVILKQSDKSKNFKDKLCTGFYPTMKIRITKDIHVGCRYNRCCLLFANARQGGYTYDECLEYLMSMLDPDAFDSFNRGVSEDEWLREDEVLKAGQFYSDPSKWNYWRLDVIKTKCDIELPRAKRNGRKQPKHMEYLNMGMDMGFFEKNTHFDSDTAYEAGRKGTKEQIVREYLQEHPNARKCDIVRETGLSKPTVYKYWNIIKNGS